jgi:hypothetical protein
MRQEKSLKRINRRARTSKEDKNKTRNKRARQKREENRRD